MTWAVEFAYLRSPRIVVLANVGVQFAWGKQRTVEGLQHALRCAACHA
jgi:hypothetical protein